MKIDQKRWLFDAKYRAEQELTHPLVLIWRVIWFPVTFVALLLFCVSVSIQFGPRVTRDVWSRYGI